MATAPNSAALAQGLSLAKPFTLSAKGASLEKCERNASASAVLPFAVGAAPDSVVVDADGTAVLVSFILISSVPDIGKVSPVVNALACRLVRKSAKNDLDVRR